MLQFFMSKNTLSSIKGNWEENVCNEPDRQLITLKNCENGQREYK